VMSRTLPGDAGGARGDGAAISHGSAGADEHGGGGNGRHRVVLFLPVAKSPDARVSAVTVGRHKVNTGCLTVDEAQ